MIYNVDKQAIFHRRRKMEHCGDIFAQNLKSKRRELGFTQKELAELIGYTEKSVSKWESGIAIAPSAVLPLLAKKLEVSIDYLFTENKKQHFFLGIDGGGTKTEFALSDGDSNIIHRTTLEGSNPVDIGIERALKILSEGIAFVCKGIPMSRISVFAGLSGGITGGFGARIKDFLDGYGFASSDNGSDAQNAVALALGDNDGTAIIIGTGSIAFTRTGGKLVRNGGYGYFFDDGGSGFAIGRDAMMAALRAEEGRNEPTLLVDMLKNELETARIIDALGVMYEGGKRKVASLAPLVFEAFKSGDKAAESILDKNMKTVAELIENAPLSSEKKKVVLVGGLAKDFDILLPYIKKHLEKPDEYNISANTNAPIFGALMLAGAKIKE